MNEGKNIRIRLASARDATFDTFRSESQTVREDVEWEC